MKYALWFALGWLVGRQVLAAPAETPWTGSWRLTTSVAAPWVRSPVRRPPAPPWLGLTVAFREWEVQGPGVLACHQAQLEATSYPAEGLFQGNLPAPARSAAQALGFSQKVVPGWRLSCDSGVFEFHQADQQTLLLALDNRVWTLSRAPGALAAATTPEAQVQRLLEVHFNGRMGFDAASVKAKRTWLSARLQRRIAAYLVRPGNPDEVPAIDGDPFTDSQEYPTRFAVQAAQVATPLALVPVRFADAYREKVVTYVLLREADFWRVDDLRFENGERLSTLLK